MGTSCCLSVSSLYLLVVCSLGHYARSIVDFMINRQGLVRSLLMEIITTVEWCACTFELIIVADVYDKSMASIIMFSLLVWSAMTWGEATASPFLAVEAFIAGYVDLVTATLTICAQIAAAAVAPMYVDWMWQLQHHCATHAVRSNNVCDSAIRDFPMGGLLTAVAVLIRRVVVRHTYDNHVRHGYVLNAFVVTACFFVRFLDHGADLKDFLPSVKKAVGPGNNRRKIIQTSYDVYRYTGGHTNPVVVTSLALACNKSSAYVNYLLVHWIGAMIGCIAACFLNRYLSDQANLPERYTPMSEG